MTLTPTAAHHDSAAAETRDVAAGRIAISVAHIAPKILA
jgi:hypothetical protein